MIFSCSQNGHRAHCHIHNLRFILEKWIKTSSNSPVWRRDASVYCGCVCEEETDSKGYKYLCMQVCTTFPCVHLVCLWRGKVSMGALAPPQTWLLLTSVSQLADWRENIPAPSIPQPPFLLCVPSSTKELEPTRLPVLGSIAAPVCHGWWKALGGGVLVRAWVMRVVGVMRLDVKNVAHGLLFCVLCARWMGPWQAGVQASQSSPLTCVLEKPEGPGLLLLKQDRQIIRTAGWTT